MRSWGPSDATSVADTNACPAIQKLGLVGIALLRGVGAKHLRHVTKEGEHIGVFFGHTGLQSLEAELLVQQAAALLLVNGKTADPVPFAFHIPLRPVGQIVTEDL